MLLEKLAIEQLGSAPPVQMPIPNPAQATRAPKITTNVVSAPQMARQISPSLVPRQSQVPRINTFRQRSYAA